MARQDTGVRANEPQRSVHLLLPAARPVAVAILAVCVAVTAFLGASFTHRTRAGWLDTVIDTRVRASLGGHSALLGRVILLGAPVPVIAMAAALVLACLATRRWRGAVLVAVAVPAAEAVTELLLKPLVGRTMGTDFSFPSGHATGVFVLAAAVVVLLAGPLRPRLPAAVRLLFALTALLAAGAVAIALVGLGYHYFTDTVGGAGVAIAAVLATALVLDKLGLSRRSVSALTLGRGRRRGSGPARRPSVPTSSMGPATRAGRRG